MKKKLFVGFAIMSLAFAVNFTKYEKHSSSLTINSAQAWDDGGDEFGDKWQHKTEYSNTYYVLMPLYSPEHEPQMCQEYTITESGVQCEGKGYVECEPGILDYNMTPGGIVSC